MSDSYRNTNTILKQHPIDVNMDIIGIQLYDILVVIGIFASFFASSLLFFFNRKKYNRNTSLLLGIIIFSWGWYGFTYLLIITGWISYIPGIYRIGAPLYYLIPPCCYLYTRCVLFDEVKLRKYDWLCFIPALLAVIDLLPFYFADATTKQAVAQAIANDMNLSYRLGSGFVPAFWHFQLRWIQGIIYLFFQWHLIIRVFKKEQLPAFGSLKSWLLSFTLLNTFIYGGLAIMCVQIWLRLNQETAPFTVARSGPLLVQIIGITSLIGFLFCRPDILYGIPRVGVLPGGGAIEDVPDPTANTEQVIAEPSELTKKERETPLNTALITQYAHKIDLYIRKKEAFKTKGYTVSELALALKMRPYHLSYILKHHYKQRYADFINGYRIEYIKACMASEEWKNLTLEGLANEAGFSSRSAFFVAFKKVTGVSPSQYLQ